MQFEMKDPLTEAQWQSIERAALKLLEKTGLHVGHDEILGVLAGRKGLRIEGKRVRFEPALVRRLVRGVKGSVDYDTRLISGAYCHNYMEAKTGEVRMPTLKDLILSARQAEALGGGVCAPVVPLDVPGPKQEIVMERVTHENCRLSYGGGQATTVAAAEASIEMSAVVSRPCEIEIWVNSPLNLDPTGLDIAWKLRGKRPRIRLSNMPCRGMSAPITLAGILAQTTAEVLGAATVLRLLNISDSITFRVDAFWMYAVDMRTGNVLLSGPDYLRLMTLSIFLGRRYGIAAPMGKALLTASKHPDAQAAAEKAGSALAVALAGAGTFTAAGALSQVEIFSPVQMVIDHEIMSWIDAFVAPLDFSKAEFALDEIDQVGPGGTFMDRESTASRLRKVCWNPKLFTMNSYPSWSAEGRPELADKARDILSSLKLADGPIVSKEQQRELAAIEKRFAAGL